MFKIGGKLSQFDWPSETEAIRSFIILVDTNILKRHQITKVVQKESCYNKSCQYCKPVNQKQTI